MYQDESGKWVCLSVGPATLDSRVNKYYQEACTSGILSRSHRSPQFSALYERLVFAFQHNQLLPRDYAVLLFSSATECWQVLADSFPESQSHHLFNGSFGQKWWERTKSIKPLLTTAQQFDINEVVNPTILNTFNGILCLTQNETSNGTAIPVDSIVKWHNRYPEALLAVDATSSMGGIQLPWSCADIWFASVQKCFGLPAGLAVMLLSRRAVEYANHFNITNRYNLLANAIQHYRNRQTTHTPNTANIYLLTRVLENRNSIQIIAERTRSQSDMLFDVLEAHPTLKPLITNYLNRSQTIIVIKTESPENWTKQLATEGLVVSSGYGTWEKNTFRIANFPTIKQEWLNLFIKQIN